MKNYYAILGLRDFETKTDKIRLDEFKRPMRPTYRDKNQNFSAEQEKLEIAEANAVLLNVYEKLAYDFVFYLHQYVSGGFTDKTDLSHYFEAFRLPHNADLEKIEMAYGAINYAIRRSQYLARYDESVDAKESLREVVKKIYAELLRITRDCLKSSAPAPTSTDNFQPTSSIVERASHVVPPQKQSKRQTFWRYHEFEGEGNNRKIVTTDERVAKKQKSKKPKTKYSNFSTTTASATSSTSNTTTTSTTSSTAPGTFTK